MCESDSLRKKNLTDFENPTRCDFSQWTFEFVTFFSCRMLFSLSLSLSFK